MEHNTLDPIRPSYNLNPQEEMSYLFGRDPSILAYGQRPCLSQDTKKNLLSVYEIPECNSLEENGSTNSESQSLQTVKVYLRIKPFPKKLKLTQEQQDAFNIINSTTLFTRLPVLDNNTSCVKRSNSTNIICRKFTFTQTFGPETTQLELFEQAVKQHMVDFLAGQNSTIMTYGTTNSGKSYTLRGTTTSPGIIPRCLEFVFSNITSKSTPSYKPVNHCDVISLDALERAQELEIKTKLLTFASVDKHQYINAYKEMQKLLQDESPIRPSQCIDAHYSVWVSFAEIYNEIVYDLLSNESQKKRTPLKLATDAQGRTFIKGLKTVCVNSGSEAYQVLMAGQYNLKVAATALNARSSRSHCIFTIRLLKYYIENDPDSVEVSTFAFCDLAGSERLKKTLNIGDRLKEAQNINTSLLVLGRCLKTIHEGQISKQKIEHIGPFRESKLTRLFQKALSGKEHIALIVNINPLPNLYTETQNVLNFSAIAKKIVIEEKKKSRKKSRFSQIITQSIKTVTDWDATELESEDWQNTDDDNGVSAYVQAEDYEVVVSENEGLKKQIAALKNSMLTRDLQIRQEMADTYTAMMKELEADWKNRIKDVEEQQEDVLQWSVKQVEDFYKQKLDQLISGRKRRRSSISDSFDDNQGKNIEELEVENSCLTSKIKLLKSSVKELKESNQSLTVEKNKLTFELGSTQEDLKNIKNLLNAAQEDVISDEETNCYVEELKSQLFAKQKQVKKLKVFLNEAKEEYIAITTEVREKEYFIKEQEQELLEKQDTIDDLEADLESINICLTEKTKTVEILEEKLENQNKKIMDNENKVEGMQAQINKLENENLLLVNEVELLKKAASTRNSVKDVEFENDIVENSCDSLKDDEYQEVFTKQEVSSICEQEVPSICEQEVPSICKQEVSKMEDENDKKDEDMGNEELDPQMEEKIIAIEAENSALKEKLTQTSTEIQSLKVELESAKLKLKDVSDQICNLQISNIKSEVENDEHVQHQIAVETVEIGCQVHIEPEEEQVDDIEDDVYNKSCQTIESTTKEEVSQTSFVEENDEYDVTLNELAKLTVKYDDMKSQYKQKCVMIEEVEQEVLSLRQRIENLSEESNTNKLIIEEYKQSIETLSKKLCSINTHPEQVVQDNINVNVIKLTVETISNYEQQLNEAKKELSLAKEDYNQCVEKLNTLQIDYDNHISKCQNEHEQTINNLKKDLTLAIERSDIKSQCLDVHAAKITELEHSLEHVTELQQEIEEFNRKIEKCQKEKEHLQNLFDENNDRLLDLEDRLERAEEKEREKDDEIFTLQKEMKYMIQKNENDNGSEKLMEMEMKNTIKHLTEAKEMLSQKENYIERLEMRIKHSDERAKVIDNLEKRIQNIQAENERLQSINEELKNNLVEKDREMEAFMKNREVMVTKYESLVKNQQEELEKQKRGVTKNHPKEKDYCENTSEDEVVLKERRIRRPPKKYAWSPKQDEITVIDLSGSGTKRNGKRTTLPPPTEPVSERKRTGRKKKLYATEDVSFQDIEPLESAITITSSPSQTRSLRSRRK